MDAKERGQKLIEELIASYPAEVQPLLREKLLTHEAGLVLAGTHSLRQDEFSRKMDEATSHYKKAEKWHADLDAWKTGVDAELAEAKAAKDELARLKAAGGGNGDDSPPPIDTSKFLSKEDAERLKSEMYAYTTNYGAYVPQLVVAHLKEFDEVLDTSALLAFCREKQIPVDRGGYETFVLEKRQERMKKQNEEALKAAEQRGYQKALSEGASAPPYPVSTGGDDNQTLAGLDPANKGKFGVASAIATYEKEIRKRLVGNGGT